MHEMRRYEVRGRVKETDKQRLEEREFALSVLWCLVDS